MDEPVRIALLGAGRIVRLAHLEALARLPGARIVAIAEADEARLAEAARRIPDAARFADWSEALALPAVEAAVICLPNPLHAEAAEAAFRRGVHVYLEKPIATSVSEGRRVLDAWRTAGRIGMTGFNYRFHPMHASARTRVAAAELGALVAVRTTFTTPARTLPPWQQGRATGGGVLLNLGVHHFDLVPFLTEARFASIAATLRSLRAEQDTALVHATLENGVPVQSLFSMAAAPADCVELVGERGTLVLDRLGPGAPHFQPAGGGGRWQSVTNELRALPDLARRAARAWRGGPEPSFRLAFGAFVAAVRGSTGGYPDIADGLRALEVVDAAEMAATHRRELPVRP